MICFVAAEEEEEEEEEDSFMSCCFTMLPFWPDFMAILKTEVTHVSIVITLDR